MIEINNRVKAKVDKILLKKITQKFLNKYKQDKKDISIALVSDAEIKRLNRSYLAHNYSTDVLAFSGEKEFFGEIIIGYDQVKRQARMYDYGFKAELSIVLVHGLFHLLGYDDKKAVDREKMNRLTEKFIDKLI